MAKFKHSMFSSLRSARQWLIRAEDAFDRERDIRGELDLILAQAELQHARENNHSCRWRYKYPLLWQGLALSLALAVITVGLGGTYLWVHEQEKAVPIPFTMQETKATPEKSVPAKPAAVVIREKDESSTLPVATKTEAALPVEHHNSFTEAPKEDIRPRSDPQDIVLPPQEMQKLVREAGKTLRGQ